MATHKAQWFFDDMSFTEEFKSLENETTNDIS